MRTCVLSVLAGLSLGLLFSVNTARAAAGSLDPTFGNGGFAQVALNGPSGSVALQVDGEIVAIGAANNLTKLFVEF